jgi:hypothetical protein
MEFLSRTQVIIALGALGLALLVLELVRRRRLSEEYSLLWMISTVVMAILGFSTPLLEFLTRTFGILYESSLVFFLGVAFGVAMLLYLSVRLSRLGRNLDTAGREIALLRLELETLRGAPIQAALPEESA